MKYVIKIFFGFYFLSLLSFSNNNLDCNSKVENIYNDIIKSIGNKSPLKPKLNIISSKTRVAYITRGEIFIEQKTIDLFCNEKDFESKIAYILSHEIAHHYLRHDWMRNSGLLYQIKDFVGDNNDSTQRKLAETQADAFAGFFSLQAGYKSLNYAKEVLTKLYQEYDIPEIIPGYHSLSERIEIINSNIEKAKNLTKIFEVGNLALACGKLKVAKNAFEDILNDDFNSREIYNNLGVSYLLFAIENLDDKLSKYSYPVFIDQVTRADLSKTRSGELNDPQELLKNAKEYFELAIENDSGYTDPKFNVLIADLLINKIDGVISKDFISQLESLEANQIKKNDLKILFYLFHDKKKKASKLLKSASSLSKLNYDMSLGEYKSKNIKLNFPKYDQIDPDIILFTGINKKKSQKFKTSRSRNIILVDFNEKHQLIEINKKKYIAEIYDFEYLKKIDSFLILQNTSPERKIAVSNFIYEVYNSSKVVVKKSIDNKIKSIIYSF